MDDYDYLDGLSYETRNMVIADVYQGKKNLYKSVISVLLDRIREKSISRNPLDEVQYYIKKQKIHPFRHSRIKELVIFCYRNLQNLGILTFPEEYSKEKISRYKKSLKETKIPNKKLLDFYQKYVGLDILGYIMAISPISLDEESKKLLNL